MFGFKLCLALNGIGPAARHPDYLMECLSASQFLEWRIFHRLHPFGEDILHQLICRMYATWINANRSDDMPAVDTDDLMPGISTDELWDDIEEQVRESRRLSRMSEQERQDEAMREFLEQHAARQGRRDSDDTDDTDEPSE